MKQTIDKEGTKKVVLDAFQARHATKVFDETKKIGEGDFDYILEAGRLSPSSFGLEPWRLVVVQNRELREKLRTVSWGAQGQLPTASHFVLVLARTAGDMHYDSDYIRYIVKDVKGLPEEVQKGFYTYYKNFQENGYHLTESDRAMYDWACKQAYIAMGNMMTAAAMIGVDSCPIEGFEPEAVNTILKEAGVLEGGHFRLAAMLAFGFRKEDPRPKIRQPKERVIAWV